MALNRGPHGTRAAELGQGWQSQAGAVLLLIFRQSVNYRGEIGPPFYQAITAWILVESKSLCLDFGAINQGPVVQLLFIIFYGYCQIIQNCD